MLSKTQRTMGLHSMFTEGQWNHMVWLFWEMLHLHCPLKHQEQLREFSKYSPWFRGSFFF